MKNFIKIVLLFIILGVSINSSYSMDFAKAFSQTSRKPMLMVIYADWAPNCDTAISNFRRLEKSFKNTYNFCELNIASDDAAIYNSRYYIAPNLPYVLMLRNSGKITRQIKRECVTDYKCLSDKVKSFAL